MSTLSELSGNDIVDLRDLWERKTELENQLDADNSESLDDDEREELETLTTFFDEESYESQPSHGNEFNEPTLILESYFEEYARQLAEDIGAITGDESWPLSHIDWSAAAEELSVDYSTVTLDGNDYYVRN